MTPLVPLSEAAATREERLIAVAALSPASSGTLPPWADVVHRARHGSGPPASNPLGLVLAFAASLLVGVGLVAWARGPQAASGRFPEVTVSAGTTWRPSSPGAVTLEQGALRVARAQATPVRVETPHLVVEGRNCRFLAEVVASGTVLSVDEGELLVRARGLERVLHAGETLTWPATPEIPNALLEPSPAPAPSTCTAGSSSTRRACLRAEAAEDTLDAQAALFELGALELREGRSAQALEAWDESLRRFDEGVLHPEVRLHLLVTLVRERRFARALEVGRGFLERCGDDPRAADVRALLDRLPRD